MAKYGPVAQQEVKEALHKLKLGQLFSSSGEKVTSREQAIAIGLSEARERGATVPEEYVSPVQHSASVV